MAKNMKTSQSAIKETRRYMQKVAHDINLPNEFEVIYDREYPEQTILYGDVEITAKYIDGDKVKEKTLIKRKRVLTTMIDREIDRAIFLTNGMLGINDRPGVVKISNCKECGKAAPYKSIRKIHRS